MAKAGTTGDSSLQGFQNIERKNRYAPGSRDSERKENSKGAGGSKNQILT